MTTKTLASSLAALAMFAAQGAVEPVWESSLKGTTINAVGFENFTAGATIGENAADNGNTDATKAYFLYSGASGEDQSVVTNHDSFAFNKIPNYFTGLDNNNYLSLSTEGGTLFRSLNVINGSNLGTAEAIPATGLFVDTLVQFTPCEEPPAFNDADLNKLAVWLGTETNATGDVVGTNLCVRAGYWDYENEILAKATGGKTYTLANTSEISVQAGEWVRLTVKAIQNVYSSSTVGEMPAFQVYINDTLAVFNEDVASAAALAQIATLEAAAQTALATKTILPSMQDAAALQAVGFQGTGAVDDFVVTTENPYAVPVDFTLYWDANILALETFLEGDVEPTVLTDAGLNHVFDNMGDGDTLEIDIPDDGVATSVASGYEIDWANTVLTNVTMEALYEDDEDPTTLYGYLFTLDGDGPYSVTLVTKSSTPVQDFDGGSGTELDPYIVGTAKSFNELKTKVADGDTFEGKFFELSGDVDFNTLGLNPFAGIGTYNSGIDKGVPFCGTFNGKGYKITNVDFTQRNYAGIFNQVKGGTIKNLTVSNINCSAFSADVNGGEFACSIIGHAGSGATLQNIVAEGTFASPEQPCTHNIAGIVIRLSANALVKDCTNNAALYGCYTKLGGIAALTQTGTLPVRFEGCVNNGTITALQNADAAKPGRDGVAGIVAYVALPTVLKDCSNTGTMSSVLTTAAIGELVGKNDSAAGILTDEGNNTGVAANKFVGVVGSGTGIRYATVDNGVATTTTNLVKDTTYLLECNVPTNATPVFALAASGDYIAFDKSFGYTFKGDVVIADGIVGLQVTSNEVNNVLTFTAEPFGAPKTVSPGSATELDASTAEAATNEAESVTIVISDAAAATAGQADVLKKVITYDEGTGKYSVELAINEDAAAFVDPDEAVAVVAGVLSGSDASVSVPAAKLTPGLYYSLAVSTDVDGTYTEGTRYLAAGEAISLPITKPEGTKAFYKVLVNMTSGQE